MVIKIAGVKLEDDIWTIMADQKIWLKNLGNK